jgi:RNA polymerase sigma-70 factor (ECF subfamily)
VLSGRATFAGRSAVRSWLTGVLKHKIVDAVRRDVRLESLGDQVDDDGPQALASAEPGPDEVAEQRQRLARTLERLDALPSSLRDVMQRRFLDDEPTDAVCRALGLTETNLFVRIHRARRQLAV